MFWQPSGGRGGERVPIGGARAGLAGRYPTAVELELVAEALARLAASLAGGARTNRAFTTAWGGGRVAGGGGPAIYPVREVGVDRAWLRTAAPWPGSAAGVQRDRALALGVPDDHVAARDLSSVPLQRSWVVNVALPLAAAVAAAPTVR